MSNMIFAKRIAQLRKKSGLTLEELGNLVKLGKTAILSWEKNGSVPNGEVLKILSQRFEVSVDYLLGNDEMMSNSDRVLFRKWGDLDDGEKKTIDQMIDVVLKNRNGGKK